MNRIDYVIGDYDRLGNIKSVKAWRPFDERVLDFLDELSKSLFKNGDIQKFPDLVSLAFWLRNGNLQSIVKKYTDFVVKETIELLNIDSPTGYTKEAADWVKNEFEKLDFKAQLTNKGGVIVDLTGKDKKNGLVLVNYLSYF